MSNITAFTLLFLTICFISSTFALQFTLRQGEETCISKDVVMNDAVNGSFLLTPSTESVSVSVRDPHGDLVYMKPGVAEGTFAYTSPKTGSYKICFQNNLTQGLKSVLLKFRSADENSSQHDARTANIKPIEAAIKQIHSSIQSIQSNEQYILNKQNSMQDQHESIASYVMIFNMVLLAIVTAGYFIQMWYLKQFFRSKNILMK